MCSISGLNFFTEGPVGDKNIEIFKEFIYIIYLTKRF